MYFTIFLHRRRKPWRKENGHFWYIVDGRRPRAFPLRNACYGEGLSRASGGRLEKILEKLTSSTIKGVLLGAGVTAVIQSSSATTVMVVGFVNSGIMTLERAVGIIMGANIGTTITSWLLSLSGLQGDNFIIQMLKPSSFSPILAIIGVAMILFSKKDKKKDAGAIMIGFAVLMTGMDTMSAAVKPLANVPEFTNLFLMFENPLLGMIAGAVLTAVIQSSSASVGILQALCVTGAVSYGSALPIIMGQNIGTCVTALISAIGAKKNAKRTGICSSVFQFDRYSYFHDRILWTEYIYAFWISRRFCKCGRYRDGTYGIQCTCDTSVASI